MKRKLMNEMSMAEPNPAHCFFGELEKRGKLLDGTLTLGQFGFAFVLRLGHRLSPFP